MKKCCKCLTEKDLSEFCKCKNAKDGLNYCCRKCMAETHQKNKHRYEERKRQYAIENREHLLDKKREYVKNHKSTKIAYDVEYRKNKKEEIAQYKRNWEKARRNEPEFKLKRNLRRRVHHALKGENKSDNTMKLIGCTIPEFKSYIESLFLPGMTWENYGPYSWHIDHIKPCYSFDLTIPEEQQKCFHYTNQRPLWAKDNLSRTRSDFIVRNKP